MSSQSAPPAPAPDMGALSGLLWTLGGLLVSLGVGLSVGMAAAILMLGCWCLATGWRIGVRR